MSIPENLEPVCVERMELRLRMDATVTVYDAAGQATDWLKPGSEAAVWWNGVPDQKELILRYNDLAEVAKATLQDVIVQVRKRLDAVRKGER
jgi:predicted nucleic acid-binding OB-fold protein